MKGLFRANVNHAKSVNWLDIILLLAFVSVGSSPLILRH